MKFIFFVLIIFVSVYGQEGSRIIGVVYDNSGSMVTSYRVDPTEYAFKLLISILDKNDTLAIVTTKMARNGLIKPRVFSCSDKEKIFRFINNLDYEDDTYFNSVNSMLSFLNGKKSDNKSMVIFTDGKFTNDLDNYMEEINRSSENANISVSYLINLPNAEERRKIEDQNVLPFLLEKFNGLNHIGAYFIQETNYSDLTQRMGDIFSQIYSLSVHSQKKGFEYQGNKLIIRAPLPISRIRFINQSTSSFPEVMNVSQDYNLIDFGTRLNDEYNKIKLYANSGLITFKNIVEPGQSITITFNSNINKDNILIILDHGLSPQIAVKTLAGKLIKRDKNDKYNVTKNDSLIVALYFLDRNRKFEFRKNVLRSFKVQGNFRGEGLTHFTWSADTSFNSDIILFSRLEKESYLFDIFASYPSYINLHKTIFFHVVKEIKTKLLINGKENITGLYAQVDQCSIDSLPSIRVRVIDDGGNLVNKKYSISFKTKHDNNIFSTNSENYYEIYFKKSWLPWENPFGVINLQIIATPNSSLYERKETTIILEVKESGFWCLWGVFLIILFLIILLIIKLICFLNQNKFTSRAKISVYYNNPLLPQTNSLGTLEEQKKLGKWSVRYYLLCFDMKSHVYLKGIGSILMIAGKNKCIYIDKKAAKQLDNVTLDTTNEIISEMSNEGKNDVRVENGDQLKMDKYRYVYTA